MVKRVGGIAVKVDRWKRPDAARDLQHITEVALDEFTSWDFILDNNGTLGDLYDGLETLVGLAQEEDLCQWATST